MVYSVHELEYRKGCGKFSFMYVKGPFENISNRPTNRRFSFPTLGV